MIGLTAVATTQAGFWESTAALAANPWGRLTLADAYFAIVSVYLLTAVHETTVLGKIVWLALFLGFGSLAIAAYALFRIPRLGHSRVSTEVR